MESHAEGTKGHWQPRGSQLGHPLPGRGSWEPRGEPWDSPGACTWDRRNIAMVSQGKTSTRSQGCPWGPCGSIGFPLGGEHPRAPREELGKPARTAGGAAPAGWLGQLAGRPASWPAASQASQAGWPAGSSHAVRRIGLDSAEIPSRLQGSL